MNNTSMGLRRTFNEAALETRDTLKIDPLLESFELEIRIPVEHLQDIFKKAKTRMDASAGTDIPELFRSIESHIDSLSDQITEQIPEDVDKKIRPANDEELKLLSLFREIHKYKQNILPLLKDAFEKLP